uniref:Uncharacterized protein n=1 Tax=Knipowitschia caucasica TaxID=637954 RepID=A0AAV2KG28_KNICA
MRRGGIPGSRSGSSPAQTLINGDWKCTVSTVEISTGDTGNEKNNHFTDAFTRKAALRNQITALQQELQQGAAEKEVTEGSANRDVKESPHVEASAAPPRTAVFRETELAGFWSTQCRSCLRTLTSSQDIQHALELPVHELQTKPSRIPRGPKKKKSLKGQVTELRQVLLDEKQETENLWSKEEELKSNNMKILRNVLPATETSKKVLTEKLQQLHREQLCSEKQSWLILEQQVQKLSEDLTSSQDYNTALELQVHELQDKVNGLHKKKRRRSWWCF